MLDHRQLSWPLTTAAIVNGSIGGSILLMPVAALHAGWLYCLITLPLICCVSLTTSLLQVHHSHHHSDFDLSLFSHFNNATWVKVLYNVCLWSSLLVMCLFFFNFIVLQWSILLSQSLLNPLINAVVLIAITLLMQHQQLGSHLLGYGMVSIGLYLTFLLWVGFSSPSGSNTYVSIGSELIPTIALFQTGLGFQILFMPILKKHPDPTNHLKITAFAKVVLGTAFLFAALMGGFGIVNRQVEGDITQEVTIFSYFSGDWEGKVLSAIFLLHFYSVFPQYLLISKKRFFGICGLRQSIGGGLNIFEVIYIVAIVILGLLNNLAKVKLNSLADFNGAVIGFCFIYLFPIMVHIRCAWKVNHQRLHSQLAENDLENAEVQEDSQSRESKCRQGAISALGVWQWIIAGVLLLFGAYIMLTNLIEFFE